MADYYEQTIVHQTIPNDCMAPIERWLLMHIFDSEPDDDGVCFFAEEYPGSSAEADEQFFDALSASRETCPELCAAVDRATRRDANEVTVDLGEIGYSYILQSIVKRHPNRLPYVTSEAAFTCSKMRSDGFGGGATLITTDRIERITTHEWLQARVVTCGLPQP